MKIKSKLLRLFITAAIILSISGNFISNNNLKAAEALGTPKIKVKTINSGTGVKIFIGKTQGASGYEIVISETDNAYSDYMFNSGKDKRTVDYLHENGTKKRSYTIEGLPKGTYKLQVAAFTGYYDIYDPTTYWITSRSYSTEKSIKIKSPKAVPTEEKKYNFKKAKVGDVIKFGTYEQDNNMLNGKEDIEWIVLSKTKKKMLIVSKNILVSLPYNKESKSISWKNCSLRKWLNKSFYKTAFTESEKTMIKRTKLSAADSSFLFTANDGSATKDNIFLLSIIDTTTVSYPFSSYRACKFTAFASQMDMHESNNCWWLRTGGRSGDGMDIAHTASRYSSGSDSDFINYDVSCTNGVRPAMYIMLKSPD